MATNEELDRKFGPLFCSFFSHDFVRKYLRHAEDEPVIDLHGEITNPPVQHVEETNECTTNAKRTSTSSVVNTSPQDESFKTAVSEAESVESLNNQESTDVDQTDTLTTSFQRVESPKSTNSGELSDENSVADKNDYDADIDITTYSGQNVKSSKSPVSDANLVNGALVAERSKYFTRNSAKRDNDFYLKEVKELKLNQLKQKSSNEFKLARKKIKLRQQKNFVDLTEDDDFDMDFDLFDEKEDLINHRSNDRMFNKPKKGYDVEEDRKILKYIIRTNRYAEIKGKRLWQDMEDDNVNPSRPWQSLKERFRKTIVPKLPIYGEMFKLNQEAIDTLLIHAEKSRSKN